MRCSLNSRAPRDLLSLHFLNNLCNNLVLFCCIEARDCSVAQTGLATSTHTAKGLNILAHAAQVLSYQKRDALFRLSPVVHATHHVWVRCKVDDVYLKRAYLLEIKRLNIYHLFA